MFYVKIWLTDGFFYNRISLQIFVSFFFKQKNLVIDCFRIKAKIVEVGRYLKSKKKISSTYSFSPLDCIVGL